MIKLYGNPYSRANRVRWALEAAGLAYVEETISLDLDGTRSERFRAINPNMHIPVLDDNGLVLFESVPICLYIAKKYMPDSLYVNSIKEEAFLLQWSIWAVTELEQHNETASLHVTWFSADKRDPHIAEEAQGEVRRCLMMLEKAIKDDGYLVARRFTIADLIVCEVLTSLTFSKLDLSIFPIVKAYLRKNLSLPSAGKAFAADIISPYLC